MSKKYISSIKQKSADEKQKIFLKTSILSLAIFLHILLVVVISVPK